MTDIAIWENGKKVLTMTKECIEREAAKERLRMWITDCVLDGDNDAADCFRDCIVLLDSIPAADVAPVQSEVNKGSMHQEYITKNRAKQFVCRHCNKVCSEEPCEPSDCDWMAFIDKEPAADVAPVRHGRWEKHGSKWQCTGCKVLMSIDGTPQENLLYYCPNCGAYMMGENNGKCE